MDRNAFIDLIQEPYSLTEHDLEALEELVSIYPYFQVAHFLIAKYAQDRESMLAPQKIRRAAAYALDRNQLRMIVMPTPERSQSEIVASPEITTLNSSTATAESIVPTMQSEESTTELETGIQTSNLAVILEEPILKPQEPDYSKSFFDLIESDPALDSPLAKLPVAQEDISEPYYLPEEEDKINSLEAETDKVMTEDFLQSSISDTKALALFNEGKIEEAAQMYRELCKVFPEKRFYYSRQLAMMLGDEAYLQEMASEQFLSIHEEEEIPSKNTKNAQEDAFFENIIPKQSEPSNEYITGGIMTVTEPDVEIDYVHFNEGIALGLYYDGKEKEAIQMYRKLMEMYPDRREYYQEQLVTLIGKAAYIENIEQAVEAIKPVGKTQSFFSGIQDLENNETQTETIPLTTENAAFFSGIEGEEVSSFIATESKTLNKSADSIENVVNVANQEEGEEEDDEFWYNEITEDEAKFFAQNAESITAMPEEYDNVLEKLFAHYERFHPAVQYDYAPLFDPMQSRVNQITEDENHYFATLPDDEADELNTKLPSDEIQFNPLEALEAENTIEAENEAPNIETELIEPEIIQTIEKEIIVIEESEKTQEKTEDEEEILISEPIVGLPIEKLDTEKEYLTESEAIWLFNQGKVLEAVKMYESLIALNPQKQNYYKSQIRVLQTSTPQKPKKIPATDATHLAQELSEALAIRLFSMGKTAEAVAVYEQLIEKIPQKKAHFTRQIAVLNS